MGAVLSQLTKEGVEHPICYASRSCNPAEQNYSSFDGECLAVVWATNQFRAYLFGNSFTLITDHEPLRWLMTTVRIHSLALIPLASVPNLSQLTIVRYVHSLVLSDSYPFVV